MTCPNRLSTNTGTLTRKKARLRTLGFSFPYNVREEVSFGYVDHAPLTVYSAPGSKLNANGDCKLDFGTVLLNKITCTPSLPIWQQAGEDVVDALRLRRIGPSVRYRKTGARSIPVKRITWMVEDSMTVQDEPGSQSGKAAGFYTTIPE